MYVAVSGVNGHLTVAQATGTQSVILTLTATSDPLVLVATPSVAAVGITDAIVASIVALNANASKVGQ
jgi:hypothetical protein